MRKRKESTWLRERLQMTLRRARVSRGDRGSPLPAHQTRSSLPALCLALGLVCHAAATSSGDTRRGNRVSKPAGSAESAYLAEFENEFKSDLEEMEDQPLFGDEVERLEKKDDERRRKSQQWIKGGDRDGDSSGALMPGNGDDEGHLMAEGAEEGEEDLEMLGSHTKEEEGDTEGGRSGRRGKGKDSELFSSPGDDGDDDTNQWLQLKQSEQGPKLHAFLQPHEKSDSA
ncbi:hypothetical protein Esti_003354 [Eimeria stiedai]